MTLVSGFMPVLGEAETLRAFSSVHSTGRRRAFKLCWINITEAKVKEERDEACFMLGAQCMLAFTQSCWSDLIRRATDTYCTLLYSPSFNTSPFYFILFSPTSSGSVALHDDVTSSDPCQSGAGLGFHGDGPDEPTEHAGQHGQRGAAPRQAPRQGSHLRH